MAAKKSFVPYRKKTPDEVKRSIDRMVSHLVKHGRCITGDGPSVRYFSRYLVKPIRKGQIYFSWNQQNKKSVIVVPPEFQLVREKHKIKLIKK